MSELNLSGRPFVRWIVVAALSSMLTVFVLASTPTAASAKAPAKPTNVKVKPVSSATAKVTWKKVKKAKSYVVQSGTKSFKSTSPSKSVPAKLGTTVRVKAVFKGKKNSAWSVAVRKSRSSSEQAATNSSITRIVSERQAASDRRTTAVALNATATGYDRQINTTTIAISDRQIYIADAELVRLRATYGEYAPGAAKQIARKSVENEIDQRRIRQMKLQKDIGFLTAEANQLRRDGAGSDILAFYDQEIAKRQAEIDRLEGEIADLRTRLASMPA